MSETLRHGATAEPGNGLSVAQLSDGDRLTLVLGIRTEADCILHWGLSRRAGGPWLRPPVSCLPEGSTPVDGNAVRTPFALNNKGERELKIHLPSPGPWGNLAFVLYFPRENRWLKDGGKDFSIPLPNGHSQPSLEEALAASVPEAGWVRQVFNLDSGDRLAVAKSTTEDGVSLKLVCDAAPPLLIHWGMAGQFAARVEASSGKLSTCRHHPFRPAGRPDPSFRSGRLAVPGDAIPKACRRAGAPRDAVRPFPAGWGHLAQKRRERDVSAIVQEPARPPSLLRDARGPGGADRRGRRRNHPPGP